MNNTKKPERIRQCAAIVCSHVAMGRKPILLAERSEPEEASDSGWQFLCGLEEEDWTTAQVWSVHEVVEIDKSLDRLVEMPIGTRLVRPAATAEWERVPAERDQE